ncbi:SRPBCC family protein [Marivirga sp.]|uniref:SRPBCC family protein n=1 Tax=Marivirga sp. TaxID=2018662 RepID=UPI0025F034C9|nr:SRPBCC family protein [Marivirga sp.]
MRLLKIIGLAILGIIVLALIVAGIADKEYAVSREITINAPHQEVFDYVKYLKNQDEFSKWATMDPDMRNTFTGVDGTVGFIAAWESENDDVGVGEQEILSIDKNRIDYALRFKEPFESNDKAYLKLEAVGDNQTKVTWGFNGSMDYPMNLMLVVMDFDEMLGTDLQYGLEELKRIMESR